MRRHVALMVVAGGLSACSVARYVPPAAAAPRTALAVRAPYEKTWDAVIDVFARDVIPIETLDKASGLVVASRGVIPLMIARDTSEARGLADCGRTTQGSFSVEQLYFPASAKYNVLVRGTGPTSTVRVTARFTSGYYVGPRFYALECSSRAAFETAFERAVKELAERP